jgi:hypothetical protein
MSRSRIVRGTYTKVSKGNHNMFSEESIISSAGQKVQQKGADQGIEHKDPLTPKQPADSVNVYVGMFFDGTGNNRFNSEKVYYSKVHSKNTNIVASTIPAHFEMVKKVNGEEVKVKIADRDSYWNPYSNVVKLLDLYKEQKNPDYKDPKNPTLGKHVILKQYVEGIGTQRDSEDDVLGSALARGQRGIIGRVEEGIKKLIKDQFGVVKTKKINKIVFDVFGFSRGASAARHFCNEVKKKASYANEMVNDPYDKFPMPSGKKIVSSHAGGLLGQLLKQNGYKPVGETFSIEIRFLGVFETVISDGIVKENLGYKAIPLSILAPVIQESLRDIKTKVGDLGIKNIFHIKAASEWRQNFAFTPTNAGHTISMLGAHSDIGGGYANLDKYTTVLDYFDLEPNDTKTWKEKQAVRQYYINHGFCKENQISFKNTYDHVRETTITPTAYGSGYSSRKINGPADFPAEGKTLSTNPFYQASQSKVSDHYMLVDERYISNEYSLVPLFMMHRKALNSQVPFYEDYKSAPDVKKTFEYEIADSVLKEYLSIMLGVMEGKDVTNNSYDIPLEMRRHICNNYLHLSANYGGLDAIGVKTGDHSLLGNLGFVNRPVPYSFVNETINYERETYQPK